MTLVYIYIYIYTYIYVKTKYVLRKARLSIDRFVKRIPNLAVSSDNLINDIPKIGLTMPIHLTNVCSLSIQPMIKVLCEIIQIDPPPPPPQEMRPHKSMLFVMFIIFLIYQLSIELHTCPTVIISYTRRGFPVLNLWRPRVHLKF